MIGYTAYFGNAPAKFTDAKTYSGLVTPGAIKRVRMAVDILLQISPGRMVYNPIRGCKHWYQIGFMTLGFHNPEDNLFVNSNNWKPPTVKEGNKLLTEFLVRMKRLALISDYVWKAEYTKRLGLHYHVTINEFINYDIIRNEWNKVLDRSGWLDSFKAMYGHKDMNSTDIHSVGKINSIGGYIASYMSKPMKKERGQTDAEYNDAKALYEEKIKQIGGQGKIWGCSKNLEGTKYYTIITGHSHEPLLPEISVILINKPIIPHDHCTIYQGALRGNDVYDTWKKRIKVLEEN